MANVNEISQLERFLQQAPRQQVAPAEASEIRNTGASSDRVKLYVIVRYDNSGVPLYWESSSEHGTGWHPRYPRQAFSQSELVEAVRKMVYGDWWVSGTAIKELFVG